MTSGYCRGFFLFLEPLEQGQGEVKLLGADEDAFFHKGSIDHEGVTG
jgi:hypothetical protein